MPKSEIKLPKRNRSSQNRENRLENIHFLVQKIGTETYSGTTFFNHHIYQTASQEQTLKYCELLYNFAIQHDDMEVIIKDTSFTESENIISLVAFLENIILSNFLLIDTIDIENGLIKLETSINAFNDMNVFDMNIAYLNFKMDENLKIGVTKCINKINQCDSGALFDHHEIDFVCGEFFEEEKVPFTAKQMASFNKTLVTFQDKFNKYLVKEYNADKKYTTERNLKLAKIINVILSYDIELMWGNVHELFDGEAQFSSMFIPVIRDVTKVSEDIFEQVLETRCRSLGETGIEYISQFIEVTDQSIENVVTDEEIKKLQDYEKCITDLCYLLNNYNDSKKKSA